MEVLLKPPMLYLVLVMFWWGLQFVPFILGDDDHFMVITGAILHVIVCSMLIHLSVPEEPWLSIITNACLWVVILVSGGYLLRYLQNFTDQRGLHDNNNKNNNKENLIEGTIDGRERNSSGEFYRDY
jgi:hypothetical protein